MNSKEEKKEHLTKWWQMLIAVGCVALVIALAIGVPMIKDYQAKNSSGVADVPESLLSQGQVVDVAFDGVARMKYTTDPTAGFGVVNAIGIDGGGYYLTLLGGDSGPIFALHLGETKTFDSGSIQSVTLISYDKHSARLLLIARNGPVVTQSADIPIDTLGTGKVIDTKIGTHTQVGSATINGYLEVLEPLGSDAEGTTISLNAGIDPTVSLHLGETATFENAMLKSATVLAFEDIDGIQGVKLFITPNTLSTFMPSDTPQ
jgi:hypothetical protein